MKRLTLCSGCVGLAVVAVVVLLCGREPITAWDSPRMLAAKRDWDFLLKNRPREEEGSKNDKLIEMQDDILRKTLTRTDMRGLAATCGMLPVHQKDPNAFEVHVLRLLVRTFIKEGDRESLVVLLSTRFQEFVGPETTTAWYLLHCSKRALKAPLLVFGEAYDRCKEPEVREQIAATVRKGFGGFDIPGKDDAEFVKNAMQLYQRESARMRLPQKHSVRYSDSFFLDP